jgi:hypothetical protein
MKPWEPLTFQYSLDVELGPRSEPEHCEYLHPDAGDPRPELASSLAMALERWPDAAIAAWNAQYERGRLLELADAVPEHAGILRDAASRLVDPLVAVRKHLYHPSFRASFGIKSVAPALLGSRASYAELAIREGNAAALAWARMIASPDQIERDRVAADLLIYCGQDTRVMLLLVREIRRLVGLEC